ncbi:uncharacterized protein LOC134207496 [Armigeres subalbatus]|uniref:uncharacterized protein LOC134207496 n=1 Tax=Armigeres subalbatus TaxID=124917 RepID=UPI002ED28372
MSSGLTKHCSKCDRPDTADNLVGCDLCDTWMHYGCAKVTDSIADVNRSWKCERCRGREEDTISRATTSSRRSSRAELGLMMMEEQKALRLRRIMEEEAAKAAARNRIADEEERFLRKKYELLLAEADEAEDGVSRKSKLSSRASREKVRSWLSEQEVGTAQQGTVPASKRAPSPSTMLAQQSTIPIPTTTPVFAASTPVIVEPHPASTSTPNSADDIQQARNQTLPPKLVPVTTTGNFVSRTEITFSKPQLPLVSTPLLVRSSSSNGMNSIVTSGVGLVQQKSDPPSIVHELPSSTRDHLSTSDAGIPIITGSSVKRDNHPVVLVSSSKQPNSETVGVSMAKRSSLNYGCPIVSSDNATLVAPNALDQTLFSTVGHTTMGKEGIPFLGGPSLKYSVAAVGDASKICAPMTTKPLSSFRIYEDYLHKHSNVPLSIPVESVPLHSSSCQPTWVNNGIPSTVVGGTVPTSVSSSLVHTAPSAPTIFSIPVVQAVSDLRPTIVPPSGGIQQPQQSTTPTRSGPSGEQLAARQVMPRELPIF